MHEAPSQTTIPTNLSRARTEKTEINEHIKTECDRHETEHAHTIIMRAQHDIEHDHANMTYAQKSTTRAQ